MKWRVTVGCMPYCVGSLPVAIGRQGITRPIAARAPPTCRRAEAGGGQGHRHLLPRPLRPAPASHDGPLRGATNSHQAGERVTFHYPSTEACCPSDGCSKLVGFSARLCTAGPCCVCHTNCPWHGLLPLPLLSQALKTEAQTAQLAARTLVSARVVAWEAQFPFPLAQVQFVNLPIRSCWLEAVVAYASPSAYCISSAA